MFFIALGLIVAGIILYKYLKSRNINQTSSTQELFASLKPMVENAVEIAMKKHIPVTEFVSASLTSALETTTATPISVTTPAPDTSAPLTAVPASAVAQYNNNEDWIVKRDADGFIQSLKIIRDAKVTSDNKHAG